jgi:hypothetical protein
VSPLLRRARRHAFGTRELPTVPRVLGPATALDIVSRYGLAHADSASLGRPDGATQLANRQLAETGREAKNDANAG